AMITGQSVNLSVLSGHLPGERSVEAKERRVERAFRDEQLTGELFLSLMLPLLPPGKLRMSLDRTTWNHGSSPLNLLVLGVVLHGDTLPLVWTALPHDGNSSTDIRQELVQRLLKALPARRWKGLVADRAFIGGAWFAFLRQQRIKRAIRIRKDAVVDGLRIDEWFGDLQVGEIHTLFDRAEVYGERMRVVATRSPAGDLVVIATDFPVWETLTLYRLRWSIETSQPDYPYTYGTSFDVNPCSAVVRSIHRSWARSAVVVARHVRRRLTSCSSAQIHQRRPSWRP
ncbi:transposase, partial [Deinococcus ruber]|uniref:transposase n=1 Tax=Deinococcus ruber TaxID=1848197 RepID=UPI001E2ABD91